MKLLLKSFSQDVNLANPEDIRYFLVFDAEGKEVKLPVQKDTTEALINLIYSNGDSNGDTSDRDDGEDVGDLAFQAPTRNQGTDTDADLPTAGDFQDGEVFVGQIQEETPESEEDVDSL